MFIKTMKELDLRQSAHPKGKSIIKVPKGAEVETAGTKYIWKNGIPYIKAKYKGMIGYISARYLLGMVLSVKEGNGQYPRIAYVSNGQNSKKIKLPDKTKCNNQFIKSHGCSIEATCIGVQKRVGLKSLTTLYSFAKTNVSGRTGSKLTISGVSVLSNKISKRTVARFFRPTNKTQAKNRILKELKLGHFVAFEQKNPIHTNILIGFKPNGKIALASYGKVKEVSITWVVNSMIYGKSKRNWFKGQDSDCGIVIFE